MNHHRILVGDNRATLLRLPDRSVHCAVTSPPYYQLRDYVQEAWEGGDPACDHRVRTAETIAKSQASSTLLSTTRATEGHSQEGYKRVCRRCGARRLDSQAGLEDTVEAYVGNLVVVLGQVRRVLRDDGTLWLNLGDTYAGSGNGAGDYRPAGASLSHRPQVYQGQRAGRMSSVPDKSLLGIPWRVALALQAEGWVWRSTVVWHKTNGKPESVRDRPTVDYEPVFMLTKRPHYYYDGVAIAEPSRMAASARRGHAVRFNRASTTPLAPGQAYTEKRPDRDDVAYDSDTRQTRSVWSLPVARYRGGHFAVMPTALADRCIRASTSERGVCPACGAPWQRQTEVHRDGDRRRVETLGWEPTCRCEAGEPVPATVLDPYGGAMTTALAAGRLGRDSLSLELNPTYAAEGRDRLLADGPMLGTVSLEGI